MKKTIFLLICTVLMTGLLFFSGAYLLDLVAMSETYEAGQAAEVGFEESGERGARSGYGSGSSGFSLFRPFDIYASDEFADVLRGFRQESDVPVTVALLASDTGANTDAVMVLRYNPKTADVKVISIPRDTYVTVKGYKFHKINAVYKQKDGPSVLKTLLGDILGYKVDYYVHFDLKTIREIVDLLGGVEYDVPFNMVYDDPDQNLHINLKAGRRTLTGKQVEGLLRFRHPNKWTSEAKKYYDGSDVKRIERQHDFLKEMLKQKLNVKYMSKTSDIIDKVYSNITTDLPLQEMLKLAKGLPSLTSEKFAAATLPGEAETIDGLSYYIHDKAQSLALADEMFGD